MPVWRSSSADPAKPPAPPFLWIGMGLTGQCLADLTAPALRLPTITDKAVALM